MLENASEPLSITEVVTVQQELLLPEILSLAKTKSLLPVSKNYLNVLIFLHLYTVIGYCVCDRSTLMCMLKTQTVSNLKSR